MFFYIVLTPISTTSGLWSTGNKRKYHQIDVYIYQCEHGVLEKLEKSFLIMHSYLMACIMVKSHWKQFNAQVKVYWILIAVYNYHSIYWDLLIWSVKNGHLIILTCISFFNELRFVFMRGRDIHSIPSFVILCNASMKRNGESPTTYSVLNTSQIF